MQLAKSVSQAKWCICNAMHIAYIERTAFLIKYRKLKALLAYSDRAYFSVWCWHGCVLSRTETAKPRYLRFEIKYSTSLYQVKYNRKTLSHLYIRRPYNAACVRPKCNLYCVYLSCMCLAHSIMKVFLTLNNRIFSYNVVWKYESHKFIEVHEMQPKLAVNNGDAKLAKQLHNFNKLWIINQLIEVLVHYV